MMKAMLLLLTVSTGAVLPSPSVASNADVRE
jgi:hypothetical protein